MHKTIAQPTRPAAVRHLQLVHSAAPSGAKPARDWEAQVGPIIRRVILAMSEAHPSTLMEELLGPLRQLPVDTLPASTDDLPGWLAREVKRALPNTVREGDLQQAALRWLWRMQTNAREPARQQYRDLLSPLA